MFPEVEAPRFQDSRDMKVTKRAIRSQLNWTILLYDIIPDGKTE